MNSTKKRSTIFYMSIAIILIGAIMCAGCVQEPPNKYTRGDLVGFSEETVEVAMVILRYDGDADEYLVSVAAMDTQGRWTYILPDREAWKDRALIEEGAPYVIGHVDPDTLTQAQVKSNEYVRGDLMTIPEGADDVANIILEYDEDSDEYLMSIAGRNAQGRWSYIAAGEERRMDRALIEENMHKSGHVDPDSLALIRLKSGEYARGDIVAPAEGTYRVAYLILGYDKGTGNYLVSFAAMDTQDRWTYILTGREMQEDRAVVEKALPRKLGHVDPDNLAPLWR